MSSSACRSLPDSDSCAVFVSGENDEEGLLQGCVLVQQVCRFAACSKGRQVRVLLLCFKHGTQSGIATCWRDRFSHLPKT